MFPVGFEGTAPRCTGNILFVWNICILINPLWLQTRVWSLSGTHFHHVNLNLLSSFNNYLQNLQKFLPFSPPPPQTPLPLPRLEQDGERRWAKCLSCGLLEQGTATHSSILAWRIPWTEEPSGLQSMGSQRVGHDWATNTHTHTPALWKWTYISWLLNREYSDYREERLSEQSNEERRIMRHFTDSRLRFIMTSVKVPIRTPHAASLAPSFYPSPYPRPLPCNCVVPRSHGYIRFQPLPSTGLGCTINFNSQDEVWHIWA